MDNDAVEIDRLSRRVVALENALAEKTRLCDRLRRIMSQVPAKVALEAKESAGFADNIQLL